MYKVVSYLAGPSIDEIRPTSLINESIETLRALAFSKKKSNPEEFKILSDAMELLQTAMLQLEKPRSRTSSLASTASLGDKIANYDKEILYTYKWGPSKWTSVEENKGAFQQWLESGYKMPPKGSVLNCWESVIVILHLYNGINKHDLLRAFSTGKSNLDDQKNPKCINTDSDIISIFLGFYDSEHKVDRLEDVQPGDIISFTSEYGLENAHVAITFENGNDMVRLGSFWTLPKEKMILVSPEKLVATCNQNANVSDEYEHLNLTNIRISKKFRNYFQGLLR